MWYTLRMTNDIVIQELQLQIEQLTESASMTRRLLDLDNVGWESVAALNGSMDGSGPGIETLNTIAEDLSDMAVTSPLVKRAIQLRHAYIYGRGFSFIGLSKPEHKVVVEEPYNQSALFSVDAMMALETAMVTSGNFFVLRRGDRRKTSFIVVPQSQITGVVTDPDDASRIYFVKRSWSSNGEDFEEWIPLSRHKKTRGKALPKSFPRDANNRTGERIRVNQNDAMYVLHHNRMPGHTWGIPLGITARIWVAMYTGYLQDNATLTKALASIAWRVSTTSAKGGANASAQFVEPRAGGAVVTGSNTDVTAMPRGNDVNFNNGQPLASMIATAFGVPVIALLSSPGATGGSYGAATTLDEPTQKGMSALQVARKEFLDEIIADMGATGAYVEFPTMASDATYRHMASLASAHATGAIWQDEYRAATLELLDVDSKHASVPKANGFNTWSDPLAAEKDREAAQDSQSADPVARQGNTGAVKGGTNQGVTNHDNDADRE